MRALALVAFAILVSACSGATATQAPKFDDQAVATAVRAASFGVTDVVIYTAETDTNKLLGRPGQYTAKVSWNDPRVSSKNRDSTIEIFPDKASLDARYAYIDGIIKSAPALLQYMYRNDGRLALLRLPKDLTPAQAQEYSDWFAKL